MKKLIVNCLASTSLTLITLAVIASLYQAKFLCISSVYQCFIVNIIIYVGLILVQKFESNYSLIEFMIEIGYVLGILVVSGFFFKWYSSIPLWVLILMGIVVYFLSCLINIIKINDDIAFINKQLKSLKAKKNQK
jgi:hypothetical protein